MKLRFQPLQPNTPIAIFISTIRMQPRGPTVQLFRKFTRITLSRKVFMALSTMIAVLLLIFTGVSIFGLKQGLGPYVAEIEIRRVEWLVTLLEKRYALDGNWEKLRTDRWAWRSMQSSNRFDSGPDVTNNSYGSVRPPPMRQPWFGPRDGSEFGRENAPPPSFDSDRPPPRPDLLFRRLGVVDAAGVFIAGAAFDLSTAARRPLIHSGKVVGYMVLAPMEELQSEADRAFLARQSGIIAATGLAGLLFALALSWWLARRWFAPIDDLTQSAEHIARGRLGTRVTVHGSDELALLGHTFNSMAERLDAIEVSRRAWLADVAHELRTPLAAMRAEIEALQDGVRTFDDKTALRLHRQVMRLAQLVDDLRSSMRESGQLDVPSAQQVPVFPLAMLSETLAQTRDRFAERCISIDAHDLQTHSVQPMVEGDASRLHRVFLNLLENTLRHTHTGGQLRLCATFENRSVGETGSMQWLLLEFDDSAPCPSTAELPRLFDRLFCGETSRSRNAGSGGGSGLGLSICRAIVEELGGTIEASASPLGGLHISLTLPLISST